MTSLADFDADVLGGVPGRRSVLGEHLRQGEQEERTKQKIRRRGMGKSLIKADLGERSACGSEGPATR